MAITYAVHRHGRPIMIGYVDAANDHLAGDVVVIGNMIGILHTDLPKTRTGAIAVGFGIYDFPKSTAGGSGAALARGTEVVRDNTNHIVSPTLTLGTHD